MNEGTHASRRRPAILLIAVVMVLSASLTLAGVASATKLGGGTTTLTAKKGVLKKLKKAGVTVKAADGATKAGKVFTFPITGGDLVGAPYTQAGTASGTVQHSGGLKFKGEKKSLSIGDFLATFAATSTLASTSGKTGVMLNLGAPTSVSSDGLTISGVKGKIAKALRKAIEKKFDVDLKTKTFGFLNIAATKDPNVTVNSGGSTSITFTQAALQKLAPEGPQPIAPATLGPPPPATLTVPVTGGLLNTQTLEGEVQHKGGVRLANCNTPSGTPVTLEDPTVLLDSTPTLNVLSSITGGRVDIANIAFTSQPTVSGNQVTISNANVFINQTAVTALNGLCGTTFAAGEQLGTANSTFSFAG